MKKIVVSNVIGLLFITLFLSPVWALSDSEALSELKSDISRLQELSKKTQVNFEHVFDTEVRILKSNVLEQASLWREFGLNDSGDVALFSEYRKQLYLVHRLEEQDFGLIHKKFVVLKQQIISMEIVLVGKKDKIKITKTINHGDTTFYKLIQQFGFARSRLDVSEQLNIEFQRKDLMDALLAVYIGALAEDTPEQGNKGMMAFASILQVLGDANRDLILDEVEKSYLQQEKMLLEIIPLFGDAFTLAEAYQGEDPWGKKLNWIDYGLAAVSVLSVMGDSVGIVKFSKNYPDEMEQLGMTLAKIFRDAADMSAVDIEVLLTLYPPHQLEMLFQANINVLLGKTKKTAAYGLPKITLKGSQTLADIVDGGLTAADRTRRARAMALARESIEEQLRARKVLDNLTQQERVLAAARAEEKIEQVAPAIDVNKLASPDSMTDQDWNALQRSLGLDDVRMTGLRNDPDSLVDLIESETGIPISALQVKGNVISADEFIAYRNANPESLRLLKKELDDDFAGVVTKHVDIKGKSGPGGIIPIDQMFSKMSKELDAAEAAGDLAEVERVMEKINKSRRGVNDIIERGIAHTSDTLEGREIIAVTRNIDGTMQRSLVTKDAAGNFYDLEHARMLDSADNVTVVKTAKGDDLKVSILVDKDGKVFVADADPQIIGTRGENELVNDTKVNGFMTRSEEILRHKQNVALKESGQVVFTQHGAQVRAYGLDLPVDSTFYVIEKGKIRFLKQDNIGDLVHYHRVANDINAPIDPAWNLGNYSAKDGFGGRQ